MNKDRQQSANHGYVVSKTNTETFFAKLKLFQNVLMLYSPVSSQHRCCGFHDCTVLPIIVTFNVLGYRFSPKTTHYSSLVHLMVMKWIMHSISHTETVKVMYDNILYSKTLKNRTV